MSESLRVLRPVLSDDPSLSPEANRLLTRELRSVIGRDAVALDPDRPDHTHERHGGHRRMITGAIELRLLLTSIGLTMLMVVCVALALVDGGTGFALIAAFALIPATVVVALVTNRMTGEAEHVSPETAAVLMAEGVGDPDRTFSDLVADFTPPAGPPILH